MSLIDDMTEPFVFMEKKLVSDGEGGYSVTWQDGTEFECAITLDTSMQARIAESQGVTSTFTVWISREINLEFHDVIKRKSDGRIFRITSKSGDKKTPEISSLDLSKVSAEEWRLPQ